MQDKDRERRRQRRLEKTRKKRADVSRPGLGGPTQRFDPAKGKDWATGECYASIGWDEPGATLDLVFSRTRPDGTSVLAEFEIDRSGLGVVSARAIGGLRREQVAGECGTISERTGRTMVACAPGLVAALVDEAEDKGSRELPGGFAAAAELLEGVPRSPIGVPFGREDAPAPVAAVGWFGRLRRSLLGG